MADLSRARRGLESEGRESFCGEGAGYAGGITSAAMDGIRTSEEIIRRYRPFTSRDSSGAV
ncbi:MAG: hypothetical protein ACLUN9_25080 [Enterocloster aldenensis]